MLRSKPRLIVDLTASVPGQGKEIVERESDSSAGSSAGQDEQPR
jgi:hypothetical protein